MRPQPAVKKYYRPAQDQCAFTEPEVQMRHPSKQYPHDVMTLESESVSSETVSLNKAAQE